MLLFFCFFFLQMYSIQADGQSTSKRAHKGVARGVAKYIR